MAIKVENAAAKSGNGTIEGVGIKADGKFKSPVTNQCFDSQEALGLHLKYMSKGSHFYTNLMFFIICIIW